jgi:hypothetical protein
MHAERGEKSGTGVPHVMHCDTADGGRMVMHAAAAAAELGSSDEVTNGP